MVSDVDDSAQAAVGLTGGDQSKGDWCMCKQKRRGDLNEGRW